MTSNNWSASFNANLFSNELYVDLLDYNKVKNKRGDVSGIIYFEDYDLLKIEDFNFYTEDMLIESNLIFEKNNKFKKLEINSFIRGTSDFIADIDILDKTRKIKVRGTSLDVAQFFNKKDDNYFNNNINFSIEVDNLYYNKSFFGKTFIEGIVNENKLDFIQGDFISDNINYVTFNNETSSDNLNNYIKVSFDDFGKFLQNTQLSNSFIGGKGELILNIDDNKIDLIGGNLSIDKVSIKNSSFLARLLQLASFSGLLEILTNEGVPFDNINVIFSKDSNIIDIKEAKLQGFSLGGRFTGTTELKNKNIDLKGVIVPAYAINNLLNKIPLIGQIITGVEGDGIIGVNFEAKGTFENPDYTVNPLSILTPGIIRSIFDTFSEDNQVNTLE